MMKNRKKEAEGWPSRMYVTYIHEESGQNLAASVYHRYRNINFNSQK